MIHAHDYKDYSLTDSSNLKVNDRVSLEDKLNQVIKHVKGQVDSVMETLNLLNEENELSLQIIKFLNTIETLRMHFQFVLALTTSDSEDAVTALKEKFNSIKDNYETIKSKEDLMPQPVIYKLDFLQNKIFPEMEKVLTGCFKKKYWGDIQFVKTEDNLAKITIVRSKFETAVEYFPRVVTTVKDDIFCLDKSSLLWQQLHSCATFKQILTKEEIKETFRPFHLFMFLSQAVVSNQIKGNPTPSLKTALSIFKDIVYYGSQFAKAETEALLYLTNPTPEHAFKGWNLADQTILGKLMSIRFHRMGFDDRIYVPRLFPQITKEVILKEYEDGTINKITPMDTSNLIGPNAPKVGVEALDDLFVETEGKVPIRILSLETLKFKHSNTRKMSKENPECPKDLAIVIHIHGGGFVSTSSASHRIYLTRWVKDLKLVHFSIDYRLAPQNKYPDALDDVWQAYLWIINYAETVLGIKHSKVIVAGDSAGGNLLLALVLRLIKVGLKPPHGCFITYPALNLDVTSMSPSRYNALNDPVLHYNMLRLCLEAYVPIENDPRKDPFVSPVVASDELLAKLPPIRIVTGEEDPLHDDCWRLTAKLTNLNKDVKLIVHKDFSHGFLCHQDMKNFDLLMQEGCEIIRELISLNPVEQQ